MNGTSSIYPDAQIGNLGSDAQSLHITHQIHLRLLPPPPAGSQVPPVTISSRQLSHLPSTPSTYTLAFLQSTLHIAVRRKKRQKKKKNFPKCPDPHGSLDENSSMVSRCTWGEAHPHKMATRPHGPPASPPSPATLAVPSPTPELPCPLQAPAQALPSACQALHSATFQSS